MKIKFLSVPYLLARHVQSCTGFKTCASSGKEVPTTVTLVLRETSLQNVNGVSAADNT